jgi:hypothetical protein
VDGGLGWALAGPVDNLGTSFVGQQTAIPLYLFLSEDSSSWNASLRPQIMGSDDGYLVLSGAVTRQQYPQHLPLVSGEVGCLPTAETRSYIFF